MNVSLHEIQQNLFEKPTIGIIVFDISIVMCVLPMTIGTIYVIVKMIINCYKNCKDRRRSQNERRNDVNQCPIIVIDEKIQIEMKEHLHQRMEELEKILEEGKISEYEYINELDQLKKIYIALKDGFFQ